MTTAVIVGYISLFAVAVQTGIIMVDLHPRRRSITARPEQSYIDAVIDGSATRLRPKLMTVAAIVLSLLPVMFSTGAGMEIMKPIAAPSIGGMITSSSHVLFMTPCLFVIGEDIRAMRQRRRRESRGGVLRALACHRRRCERAERPDRHHRKAQRRWSRRPGSSSDPTWPRRCQTSRRKGWFSWSATSAMGSSGSSARALTSRAGSRASIE